jgi:hypothetical protein
MLPLVEVLLIEIGLLVLPMMMTMVIYCCVYSVYYFIRSKYILLNGSFCFMLIDENALCLLFEKCSKNLAEKNGEKARC